MKLPTDISEVLKLENQICFPLYASGRLIAQAYGPSLEKLGLTYPQYLVLIVLWQNDGQTVKHIGEKLLLDSGTLTPVLQKLEASGLVERNRSGTDDRQVNNYLTKKALKLKEKAAEMSTTILGKSGLSQGEARELRASLYRLLGRLLEM